MWWLDGDDDVRYDVAVVAAVVCLSVWPDWMADGLAVAVALLMIVAYF